MNGGGMPLPNGQQQPSQSGNWNKQQMQQQQFMGFQPNEPNHLAQQQAQQNGLNKAGTF